MVGLILIDKDMSCLKLIVSLLGGTQESHEKHLLEYAASESRTSPGLPECEV
jgi:hypothetical protein